MHGTTQHLPFKFPGDKKFAFAAKLTFFLAFGFSIPFIAAGYQLYVLTIMFVGCQTELQAKEKSSSL
jgi:hypothetical protein